MSDRRYGADEHNTDYERGREAERRAIVKWLIPCKGWSEDTNQVLDKVTEAIKRGVHLAGDDE